jgi:two-component SAPR family response regulator
LLYQTRSFTILIFSFKKSIVNFLDVKQLFADLKEIDDRYIRRLVSRLNGKIERIGKVELLNNKRIELVMYSDVKVDLWEMEKILSNFDRSEKLLEKILDLYTGPFLAGIECLWAKQMRRYYNVLLKSIVDDYLENIGFESRLAVKLMKVFPDLSIFDEELESEYLYDLF